jgi:hypothetical protein
VRGTCCDDAPPVAVGCLPLACQPAALPSTGHLTNAPTTHPPSLPDSEGCGASRCPTRGTLGSHHHHHACNPPPNQPRNHPPPPVLFKHTHTRTGLWSIALPNAWNFGFSYYVLNILIMLTYIPGGWVSLSLSAWWVVGSAVSVCLAMRGGRRAPGRCMACVRPSQGACFAASNNARVPTGSLRAALLAPTLPAAS